MNDNLSISLSDCMKISAASGNFRMKWAADAIAVYIHSGRASSAWVKAFTKADKTKLLESVAAGRDHSDLAIIRRATKYLEQNPSPSA